METSDICLTFVLVHFLTGLCQHDMKGSSKYFKPSATQMRMLSPFAPAHTKQRTLQVSGSSHILRLLRPIAETSVWRSSLWCAKSLCGCKSLVFPFNLLSNDTSSICLYHRRVKLSRDGGRLKPTQRKRAHYLFSASRHLFMHRGPFKFKSSIRLSVAGP